MRLVWSQSGRRPDDRPRTVLLVSVLCLFLGGVVVGAGGRDLEQAPKPVRAAFASLLTTGGLLFLWGLALLALRKTKKEDPVRLTLAGSQDEKAASETQRHFGQEERR